MMPSGFPVKVIPMKGVFLDLDNMFLSSSTQRNAGLYRLTQQGLPVSITG